MQSGISISPALLDAFTSFTGDPAAFALPVTITDEALTPLPSIPFATATNGSPFFASLPQLSPLLSPNTPLYLILRRDLSDNATASASTPALTIVTYIPSASPVRAKTLFASTRATLPRELGSGAFAAHVFAAEPAEVADAAVWRERDTEAGVPGDGHGGEDESMAGEARKREAMADEERQAEILKEEESKARGTVRRDIGIGGRAGAGHQVPFPVGEGVEEALTQLDNEGAVVQLAMNVPTETLVHVSTDINVSPDQLSSHIPNDKPQYTLYHYTNSAAIVFIYTCPPTSSIKERMFHASSRNDVVFLATEKGVKISHRIEGASGDEISAQNLAEEINPPKVEGPKRAFARPKRPGR